MKKIFCFFLIISLCVFVQPISLVSALKENISANEAEEVVSKFIREVDLLGWDNAAVQFKADLYDSEDVHLGFLFYLLSGSNVIGYVITSSSTDREPVLEFGETMNQVVDEHIKGSKKLHYLGASQYVFASNKSELYEIIAKRHGNNKQIKPIERDASNKEKWNRYLESSNQIASAATTLATNLELAVPRIWQRTSGVDYPGSACGPTTAAMISNFLKGIEGHPIRGTAEYGTVDKFIDHLYYELNATQFGTSMPDWRQGFYFHLNHNYTPTGWGVGSMRATDPLGGWEKYRERISAHRPVALRFDFWTSEGVEASYHFVAGNGIKNVSGVNYFGYKDPDGGQYNTGTHWASWTVNDQDMDMGYPVWNWD
ncbi:hypothetical protein KZ483_07175 [Paenibacillus sp. sptzw28]|uniref:hypothetical protein n=1 Tax=Paenibacillus sp. sptzw28 TaxID=715179 RepID=UPI001C6E0C39|nr:hypothetical protein [Paenibacillus sp. sptzw28]QYR22720.1 hypothetical protein KZ483_07175 [Paenibacillus sp. sptzw28]